MVLLLQRKELKLGCGRDDKRKENHKSVFSFRGEANNQLVCGVMKR